MPNPKPHPSVTFAVITRVNGNDYDEILEWRDAVCGWDSSGKELHEKMLFPVTPESKYPEQWLHARLPVFELGEILIVDGDYGREVSGMGRKPSKWNVGCEYFDNVADAIACAKKASQS